MHSLPGISEVSSDTATFVVLSNRSRRPASSSLAYSSIACRTVASVGVTLVDSLPQFPPFPDRPSTHRPIVTVPGAK